MTPLQLRDYIIKHMTAEDALLKLLSLQTDQYDKIKLGQPIEPKEGDTINPLMILCCATLDLGWDIMIEKKDGEMDGLVIGKREFIDRVKIGK